MRLLYRFYEPGSGSIKIAGIDTQQLTQLSLRCQIGLVPQLSSLFNETVKFNIAYGRPDRMATDAEIEDAAKAAAIHERILSFPDGYLTRVGERGQRLSGGEQQRGEYSEALVSPRISILICSFRSSRHREGHSQGCSHLAVGKQTVRVQ